MLWTRWPVTAGALSPSRPCWHNLPPPAAKPLKQPPPAKRPNAADLADLADLKAAEWQAKQEAREAKAHQQALKATIRAEKAAQQAQARASFAHPF